MSNYDDGRREFAAWIAQQGVTLVALNNHGPKQDDDGQTMNHYTFKVRNARRNTGTMHFSFHTGTGWTTDPALTDLFSSLFMDARSYLDAADWEDFASNYESLDDLPYRDVKRYQAIYNECGRVSKKIERLFGEVDWDAIAEMLEKAGM